MLAGLQFLGGILLLGLRAEFVPGYDPAVAAIIVILLGLVFAGLGVLGLFRPVLALVIGVLLYFFVTAADFIALARAKAPPRVNAGLDGQAQSRQDSRDGVSAGRRTKAG